ncbi:MAG: hypothetical protein GY780_11680 [bacterium]|nr:hypothetical protein [bacterium]
MKVLHRALFVALVLVLGLVLASCNGVGKGGQNGEKAIFGDGRQDISEVIARVGDEEITQKQLDQHFNELVPRLQKIYKGEAGKQLLLKEMVDKVLFVQGAENMGLKNRSDVGQTLITQYRETMISGMKNIGILEGKEPTEDEIQAFFRDNRKEFVQQGMVNARHIECLTLREAEEAYQKIKTSTENNIFMKTAVDYSINKKSMENEASVGWYNRSGVIPQIRNSKAFINATFDLPLGVNRPVEVGDRWHVVEIIKRRPSRAMTFNEAREIAKNTMLPGFNDALVKNYLREERKNTNVELLGTYTPGQGLDPEAILERASQVQDPGTKLDYYRMLYTDFPDSDRADDALFMCGLICLDTWQDRRLARRYLDILINEYPDSELLEDATFLRENMYKPEAMNPESIDQLRGK